MANQSNYHRDGNHSFYPSLPSISREMGPPLDFPLQPMEIDLNASRTMLPQGLGDVSYASSNVAKMAPMDGFARPQDPITQWYTGNDGPWIPHKVIPELMGDRLPSKHSYRHSNPSEAGSSFQYNNPRSDSGYGTRRSVGNTSVFSVDQDCQSLASHVTDFHQPFPGINEVIHQRDTRVNEAWAEPSDQPLFVCQTCEKVVKTQSELKKHNLRHTKPFVCSVQGCSRTEGFSTANDLERHTKSKHPMAAPDVPTKKYRCYVPGCKSGEKSWPRLDNFKSHVQRVHLQLRDGQFNDILRRAEVWETPMNVDQELTPQMAISQPRTVEDNDLYRPKRPEIERQPDYDWKPLHLEINEPSEDLIRTNVLEQQDSKPAAPSRRSPLPEVPQKEETVQPVDIFPTPDRIPEVRITTLLAPVSESGTTSSINLKDKANRQPLALDAAVMEVIKSVLAGPSSLERTTASDLDHILPGGKASPLHTWSNDSRTPSPQGSSSPSNHADSPSSESIDLQAQNKAIEVLRVLHERGYTVQNNSPVVEPEGPQNAGSVAGNKSENQVTCQTCKKFRGRPCELKKHMKRHERPYGCTFSSCSKTFGSKNDWKRHENSQHSHLETWRCDEVRPESEGSAVCAKVCYRKQTFREHLSKAHHIESEEEQKKKLDACRMGRNCQSRFWCGFCETTIEIKKSGLDAWTERFDHIDDHFMGRREMKAQSILDWTPVDWDKSKKESDINDLKAVESLSPPSSGVSPANSSDLKRNRSPDEREQSTKKIKLAKTSGTSEIVLVVYCCQCKMQHNSRFDRSCTSCPESHVFCSACERRKEVRRSES